MVGFMLYTHDIQCIVLSLELWIDYGRYGTSVLCKMFQLGTDNILLNMGKTHVLQLD